MKIHKSFRFLGLAMVLGLSASAFSGDARIVGGTLAPNHAYPFIVGIEEVADSYLFCGGSLISPTKVLTAAHCIFGTGTTPLQIRIGTNNALLQAGRVHQVTTRVRHPKYNNRSLDYDVAILTLEVPVQLSDTANIVALPQACASLQCITGMAKPGTVMRVAGWGATNANATIFPNGMRQVDVPVVGNGVCNEFVGGITARMLCAGFVEGGRDSCSGDSGGPLFAYLPAARGALQAGVVSWGNGCAQPDQYGVYTRISHPEIRAFIYAQSGI